MRTVFAPDHVRGMGLVEPAPVRAVDRPQPCRRRARRMLREPEIAGEMRLENGDAHAVVEPQFLLPSMSPPRGFSRGTMTESDYRPPDMAGPLVGQNCCRISTDNLNPPRIVSCVGEP